MKNADRAMSAAKADGRRTYRFFAGPVQNNTLALKIAASGLAASRIELEITETLLIRDDATALAMLHQLRALGVRIALDDFDFAQLPAAISVRQEQDRSLLRQRDLRT